MGEGELDLVHILAQSGGEDGLVGACSRCSSIRGDLQQGKSVNMKDRAYTAVLAAA